MFHYHNYILRNGMEKLLETFRDICDGRDISIGSLVRDKDGHYSDEKLVNLIDEVVMADYSKADMYAYSDTERYKRELDYLSTLLYVIIRASQAGLNRIIDGGDFIPVKDDSFASIVREFRVQDGFISTLISGSMKATIETVYMLLSGKTLTFPDPYRERTLKGAKKEICVEEEEPLPEEVENEEAEEEIPAEDIEDYDLISWDDDDIYTDEEKEAIYMASIIASIRDEEEEEYYKGDEKSREDYSKYHIDDGSDEWWAVQREREAKYSLGDPTKEEYKERYEKEKKRLMIFFAAKQEFIKKYEHLYEITTAEDKEFAKREKIEAKINAWLKDNDKTLYMNDDDYMAVYESLCEAVSEARIRQGKNK